VERQAKASKKKLLAKEKPSKAAAVKAVLTQTTFAVPNLFIILAEKKLDTAVKTDIIIVIKLAFPIGIFKSA
jgi:hypothetical protein